MSQKKNSRFGSLFDDLETSVKNDKGKKDNDSKDKTEHRHKKDSKDKKENRDKKDNKDKKEHNRDNKDKKDKKDNDNNNFKAGRFSALMDDIEEPIKKERVERETRTERETRAERVERETNFFTNLSKSYDKTLKPEQHKDTVVSCEEVKEIKESKETKEEAKEEANSEPTNTNTWSKIANQYKPSRQQIAVTVRESPVKEYVSNDENPQWVMNQIINGIRNNRERYKRQYDSIHGEGAYDEAHYSSPVYSSSDEEDDSDYYTANENDTDDYDYPAI